MHTRDNRKKTPVTLLAVAIALSLQGQASAQQAEPAGAGQDAVTELDRVEVVASYRASLERALDIKRGEAGMVDAIVAEDIGKFPDLNLAESLQRVAGVTITRDAGEGRNISVRGLGPDFTRVRLNGLEALTTTGGTDSSGGANRGRGFDFNAFASDLFSQLIVRKTPSADVEEGSLGATVDLRTARPFDYNGFTFSANGQVGYNDLAQKANPRVSALISNTWADDRFGALLSVAYTDRQLIEEGSSTVRWDPATGNGNFNAASPFADARLGTTFHPRIPRYGVMRHDQQRLGMTSSLQFAPSERTRFDLDVLYAKFEATRSEDYFEAVSFSRSGAAGKPATIVREGVVDANGNLVYGVFDNVDIRSESRFDDLSTEFTQYNLGFEHRFTDDFGITALLGHSKSEHDNPVQTTVIMDKLDALGYRWDYRGNSRLPAFDYGSVNPTDPTGWTLAEIRLRPQWVENTYDSGQLDFNWNLSAGFRLKGGVQFKEYGFASREWRRASEAAVPALSQDQRDQLNKLVQMRDIDVTGNPSMWVVPDVDAYNALLNIYSNSGIYAISDRISGVAGNNRSVTERNRSFYLQGDFSIDLGPVPVSGNIGVRHVKTEQSSTGYNVVGSSLVPTTIERDYSNTLPSLNLVAEVTPDFLIRFAAAKVMARSGLGNLTPGVTVNVSGGNRVINSGNPFLDPFRATTYDLGFEWYFDAGTLLGLGLFYKDIDSFVQTTRENRVFNTLGLDPGLLAGTTALPTDEFQYNFPVNTEGGPLRGAELNYQQPFRFLPGRWSNLGFQFNYTYVDSQIQYTNAAGVPTIKTDLLGLSKHAYATTLYYDGERFSARVSATQRDDYLTTAPGRNNNGALPVGPGNNDVEGTKGTTTIDASISWKLDARLEISLEALNLTDEWNDQWIDSAADRSVVYTHTGREVLLGLRYKF